MRLSVACLTVALLAVPAAAIAQTPPAVIALPIWEIEAPIAGLPYPFAFREYESAVVLTCRVEHQRPVACEPQDTTVAANFLEASRTAAGSARLAVADGDGLATEGRNVVVTVRFPPLGIPVAIDPPPAPPAAPVLTGVVWIERPGSADFVREYPSAALNAQREGRATLDCLVGHDGRIACTVIDQYPEGEGFGDAALRLSRLHRAAPQTRDGVATSGGRVRLTLRFGFQ